VSVKQTTTVRVDAQGNRKQALTPAREERFSAAAGTSPELAQQLTRMHQSHAEVERAVRAAPRLRATVFEGQVLGAGGATTTLRHGYGVTVRWAISRWRSAAGGHSVVESSQDNNVLVLASYVAGTADVEVWPLQ
jgi:hypothetical protein